MFTTAAPSNNSDSLEKKKQKETIKKELIEKQQIFKEIKTV